jgi:hypothetical protein
LKQALALAREQGARWWELRTTPTWAQLALEWDTRAAARRAHRERLSTLIASFTEGLDTADVQDAQHVLAALR